MLNLIVAPNEISKKAEKITKKVVKHLKRENVEFSVYFSHNLDEISTNVDELVAIGEREFVVVGNDICISRLLNNVKNIDKITLGIIPINKHDDFAHHLGLKTHPIDAITNILKKNISPVDYLIVNDRIVIDSVVIGATVELKDKILANKNKNFFTEMFTYLKYGNSFEGINLKLTDKTNKLKTEIEENIYELTVANGNFLNGDNISPLSNSSDGLFNVNYVQPPEVSKRKKYLQLFKSGKHIYQGDTHQSWLTNLTISSTDNKIKAMLDGEIFTFDTLNISIVEKGLKMFL